MSGTRLTRRVTVEGGKKVSEVGGSGSTQSSSSYNPRRSVFERLGPGAVDRAKPRDGYQQDRCRNWLRDGHCPYGNNCKFLHGPFTEPKPRSRSVRSVIQSGPSDRSDEADDKPGHSRTRSLDSIEFEEDEPKETQHKQKKPKVDEEDKELSMKKTVKVKKKHSSKHVAEEGGEDSSAKKRKKKAHKKREISPSGKPHSLKEESGDWGYQREPSKSGGQWEEQGDQLELEKRRQDLQRQLALMDEQDAAATDWKPKEGRKEKEEDQRRVLVPVVHSKLHPSSATPPTDASTPPPAAGSTKKKKKKKDSEGKVKVKKDGSPRIKEEGKKKPVPPSDNAFDLIKKRPPENEMVERYAKKVPRVPSEKQTPEEPYYDSPPMREEPMRKRPQEHFVDDVPVKSERFSPEPRSVKPRRHRETPTEVDEPRYEEGRPRTSHGQKGEYHGSRDLPEEYPRGERVREQDVRGHSPGIGGDRRSVPSYVRGHSPGIGGDRRSVPSYDDRAPPPDRRGHAPDNRRREEEIRTVDRGRRQEELPEKAHSRDPRTPSPHGPPRGRHMPSDRARTPSPHGPPRGRHMPSERAYDDATEDIKSKKPIKGSRSKGPRTPPGEPGFEDIMMRDERSARGRHDEPHAQHPHSPPSDEEHGFSPPTEPQASRNNRFSERDQEFPRRHRDAEPTNEQGYPGRGRGENAFERRPPREDDHLRGRKPTDEYPRARGRDESYERGRPRESREEEYARPGEREKHENYPKTQYRDDRPEDLPRRGREEPEYPRPRQAEREEGRPPREHHERESREERDIRYERDDRDSRRQEGADNRVRERQERPGERGRDSRYSGPPGTEYHRRPSPSPTGPPRSAPYGPPRGRSPPYRYDDRRGRSDEGYRGGRGRGGRGRGGYNSYDNRGKPGDMRRRTPPPGPPRLHDRGPPPRSRDGPPGRGRGYVDKRGPPGDRFRDQGTPWDRRQERDVPRDRGRPYEESRDKRPHDSPPPAVGFKEQRAWEDRRGSPQPRNTSPHLRPPYEGDREGPGPGRRPVERETHSTETEPTWAPDDDSAHERVARAPVEVTRKRPRPAASRSLSPFEPKKSRGQSMEKTETGAVLGHLSPASGVAGQPAEEPVPEKTPVVGKEKKIKKKKEGKKASRSPRDGGSGEGVTPETEGAVEGKIAKSEKKIKKEKKLKEKGTKKKSKKISVTPFVDNGGDLKTGDIEMAKGEEHPLVPQGVPQDVAPVPVLEGEGVVTKAGKKRKHSEGEAQKGKEGEKVKKKKKKKHQPEVVVQPWADLEGDDDQPSASEVSREKPEAVTEPAEAKPVESKAQDEMFSDWSDDDSPGGDESWLDTNTPETHEHRPQTAENVKKSPVSSPTEQKGPSFDDVYDPISDDEFDAMYAQSEEEGEGLEETSKALGVEEVDWSSIGLQETKKEEEPGAHLQRFKPGHVFSRIGISPSLAGPRLTQRVRDACANSDEANAGSRLFIPPEGPKCLGAYVAVAAARKRQRDGLLSDLGPCRRALCARRDLAIRKQLGKTSTKLGKVAIFASPPPAAPVDRELFQMSVALYKKGSLSSDSSVRIVPSKVGSIVLSQA